MRRKQIKTPIVLRGRSFSENDLRLIRNILRRNRRKGRTAISRLVCEALSWRQPNGWLKDRACRDALGKLENEKYITLPVARVVTRTRTNDTKKSFLSEFDLETPIRDFPNEICLKIAKGNKTERIWNEVVRKFHYLGHRVSVGRCIKYLVVSGKRILGAIAFSSPAWHLEARDAIVEELNLDSTLIRDYVLDNSRFLILPNVEVPNLASRILSLATKKIVSDWAWYYSITPLLVETFVQPSRYLGTCYKAANWIQLGLTRGYAKRGSSHHNSQEPKQIFLYGLNPEIRRKMTRLMEKRKVLGVNNEF